MKTALKWVGIVLGGLVGLIALALVVIVIISNGRMNKTYDVDAPDIPIPTDEESIAEGERLATIHGCRDCHMENLGGGIFIDDPMIGRLSATNLTTGEGGEGQTYSDEDYLRVLLHGVDPEGKPVLFMPSQEFIGLSDGDIGKIVAYVKSVEPVDNVNQPNQLRLLGHVLNVTNPDLVLLPAEVIDHNAPRPQEPTPGETAEYGAYLAQSCIGCHGPGLSGGAIPGAPPEFLPAENITPDAETGIGTWTREDFFTAMRAGTRPDGTTLDEQMPWKNLGAAYSDEELGAIWLHLQTVEPKPAGNR